MSLYDTVFAINISDKKFKHNGIEFQTKDFSRSMSTYVIYDSQLYCAKTGGKMPPQADIFPHDGSIHIYSLDRAEYALSFMSGNLLEVKPVK